MNPLVELNHRHPVQTTILGVASGLSGWFFNNLPELNAAAVFIGTVLGILLTLLTICLKIDSWLRPQIARKKLRLRPPIQRRQQVRDRFERDRWEGDELP